ncbi:uncharacterized protein LAESUDRAFT_729508 [Laetiporus sulphureus 93-53]|uniref:Uncharacterized protein n=1 Tax=Laetiporus sulphureus 93-53 TaxID=1314785 RepID=A0A165CL17_9APHY|nr:uncharacterized protein LAESUDRAFT_729508 [Laetiporus sulphureus 93-53]KZT03000.1 hypothetical protein LAESUDRAFT_729508 [Laetiporus sulphureus 93-53]
MAFAHTRTSRVKNEQFWVLRRSFEKRPTAVRCADRSIVSVSFIEKNAHGARLSGDCHVEIWQTWRYAEGISSFMFE